MTSGTPAGPKRLIVNADDYGLTEGVSRAILRAHAQGVVTSTSVLALAPGFAPTVGWLHDHPDLGTGAHLAAVGEDPPLLSAREVPSLVDRRGRLRLSWRQFLPLAAAGRIDPDDLRRELTAQMEAIVGAGVVVDHLDTHQNLHLWPMVRDVVLDVGDAFGVRTIRVTRSAARSIVGVTVQRLAADLEGRLDRRGWSYAPVSTGLDEAGHLGRGAMVTALERLSGELDARGGGVAELASHPGEAGDVDLVRYRWDYAWADELAALCSATVRSAVDELGFERTTFAAVGGTTPTGTERR